MEEAVRHVLELAGEHEMARAIPSKSMRRNNRAASLTLTGMDLVTSDVWMAFCKLRGIDAKSVTAVAASYVIPEPEAIKLGLIKNDNDKKPLRSVPPRQHR